MRMPIRRRLVALGALATLAFAGTVAAATAGEPGRGTDAEVPTTGTDVPSTPEPTTTTAPAPDVPRAAEPTTTTATTSEPPAAEAGDEGSGESEPLARSSAAVYAAVAAGVAPIVVRARPSKREPTKQLRPPQATPSGAVLWLTALLPDPTPPSLRLTPGFARQLRVAASREGVDWALVLAVVRARGRLGAVPAGPLGLKGVAALLADATPRSTRSERERAFAAGWTESDRAIDAAAARRDAYRAILARISRDPRFTDRAVALALYYRAVGLRALHRGLAATKPDLAGRLLRDARVSVYAGGRADIEAGRIDIRVLTVIAYLTATYGQVTVSSLETGHGLFSRPGVISAHAFGRAVDITALGGVSIQGHQQPESVTADAVRTILLLPAELLPQQVISLLGLGGPSFPLADHYDHIHVGY